MNKQTKAYLALLVMQCLVCVGMTVMHFVKVFGTEYYLAIVIASVLIVRIYYTLGSKFIRDYYISKKQLLSFKSHLIVGALNFYNLLLIVIWLYM